MSDKTLVEMLREVDYAHHANHTHCQIADALGIKCEDKNCDQCGEDMAHALADTIEHEYLPRQHFDELRERFFYMESEVVVADADGVPIRKGDVLYSIFDGWEKAPIASVSPCGEGHELAGGKPTVDYEDGEWDYAYNLTHKQPDSLERIEEDATMPPRKYVADRRHDVKLMDDEECVCWMCTDLLRRQREVLERGR